MSGGDYWLGVATPFVAAAVIAVVWLVADWLLWWRLCPDRAIFGRGIAHEVETVYPEDGTWGRVQHPHYWPPGTPWWLIRRIEWLRIRACLRRPEYRAIPSEGSTP